MRVFISAFKSDRTLLDNLKRTEDMASKLSELGFEHIPVFGVYKGTQEYSFEVCETKVPKGYDKLLALAKDFDQESILVVAETNGCAWLQYMNHIEALSGEFQQVSREVAESLDSYSKIGQQYWAVIE
jgi:hypothetical protein